MTPETKCLTPNSRCCGRKPIIYKRPPHLFCCRCNAAFDPVSGVQIANWAYVKAPDGGFVRARQSAVAALKEGQTISAPSLAVSDTPDSSSSPLTKSG